jgi:hypothetical protein
MVIKRIAPLSCAKIAGTLYAVLGLFIGAVVSLIASVGGFGSNNSGIPGMGAMIGVGAIVVAPIFYGCLGFFGALIGTSLYNLVAGMVGGIELEVQ